MPRNGSGVYNLPAGNPVQPNTTIQSSWANTTLTDMAVALTASLTKDGQTTPSANLPMGSFKHTGVANSNARNQYAATGQVQDFSFNWCGTGGGTADAITLTPSVGITAYAAGQVFWFIPSGANTGAVTVAVSSLATKALTKNGTTALSAGDLSTNRIYSIVYDGTRFQLQADPLGTYAPLASPAFTGTPTAPTAAQGTNTTQIATTAYVQTEIAAEFYHVPVRQTVLSGPVDSNGLSDFGGSTGSGTVTATGTLIVAAAGGADSDGVADRVGSITNPSWVNLTTNGTMYLYLDVAANGTCTVGSSTLAPVYQWGGTYSVASGQFTFNIMEQIGKVGDGAAAAQAWRVYVGEVTVAGGVVTAITWYSLMGRIRTAEQAPTGANTTMTFTHNLGVTPAVKRVIAKCTNAVGSWSVGDEIDVSGSHWDQGSYQTQVNSVKATRNAAALLIENNGVQSANLGGTITALNTANFTFSAFVERGW